MRAWHDYHLTGYAVDGEGRRITLNVSWPYNTNTDIKRAVVVFSGVAGYFLENDLGGNILDSLSEMPLKGFLVENAERFQQQKKWGWPLFWKDNVEQTFEHLSEGKVRCFEVASSYG